MRAVLDQLDIVGEAPFKQRSERLGEAEIVRDEQCANRLRAPRKAIGQPRHVGAQVRQQRVEDDVRAQSDGRVEHGPAMIGRGQQG